LTFDTGDYRCLFKKNAAFSAHIIHAGGVALAAGFRALPE
jgi:hypothetical protein